MSRKILIALITLLALLAALSAFVPAGSAAPTVDLTINNVDGTWSNPSPGGASVVDCFLLENTLLTTDENKISAGTVNSPASNGYPSGACYTDTPPNGPGYDEGSGFGFDGAIDGPTVVSDNTPFLLGVLVHYNRRLGSLTGLDGAELNVATHIDGSSPNPVTFSWDIELDETPNDPDDNPDNTCPYPAGSFYSPAYLAFNGGFDDATEYPAPAPFGSLYTHPNAGGNPPFTERIAEQWLCGDGITASVAGGTQATVDVGGVDYTVELLGITYPVSTTAMNLQAADVDVDCGDPPTNGTLNLVFETKELNDTPGCIWAVFTVPTAVSMAQPVSAGPATTYPGSPLTASLAMAALVMFALLLWKGRAES